MKTLSLSETKMKLSALVETLRVTGEEIMITKNGEPAAVLVSPEEVEGWKETIAVRSDADLMAEIKKGLAALKKKKAKVYTLDELFRLNWTSTMVTTGKITIPEALANPVCGMHPRLKSRFKEAFLMILNDPCASKALREEPGGLRSFRVKRMRIIYRISVKEVIEVVAIGPRKTICEEIFKIVSRE